MDDDQFNDFQQAVEGTQETQPQNSYKEDELNKLQTNFVQNKFTHIDSLLINPSSQLAAEPIQSPNTDIEIKDLEGPSQPRLNKIQSENLSSFEHVFFDFDKNYARTEPTIELIDYSNVNYVQQKNLFNEILTNEVEDSAFQNLENTNLDQNIKIQKEYQQNETFSKQQRNLDLQEINISENTYQQRKVEDVKDISSLLTNYQQQNQKEQIYQNTKKGQTENQKIKIYKEQQQINIQQTNQQKQEVKNQSQEEDQFGDFQQTLPNTEQTHDVQIQNLQNQDYRSEIPQPQQDLSIMKKRTRKQQLQQFVNTLPDYSFLFLQAFQSF